MTSGTIITLFPHRPAAEVALRDLKRAGFSDEEVGIIMQDPGKPGFADDSLSGGLVSLLGSLLIPGVGPLLLGGALASTFTTSAAPAGTGRLVDVLVGLGASEVTAEHFESGLRAGGVVVAVQASKDGRKALSILHHHEADFGGQNRRFGSDPDYSGPERRLLAV
jgi:hypothetical protein